MTAAEIVVDGIKKTIEYQRRYPRMASTTLIMIFGMQSAGLCPAALSTATGQAPIDL